LTGVELNIGWQEAHQLGWGRGQINAELHSKAETPESSTCGLQPTLFCAHVATGMYQGVGVQ
jgi:hypothetical protein